VALAGLARGPIVFMVGHRGGDEKNPLSNDYKHKRVEEVPMSDTAIEDKSQCMSHCEDRFVSCTHRMPSGCVEDLRLCRESCRLDKSQ
jgi:hypothetical protein